MGLGVRLLARVAGALGRAFFFVCVLNFSDVTFVLLVFFERDRLFVLRCDVGAIFILLEVGG
jgi:hypothetical protein